MKPLASALNRPIRIALTIVAPNDPPIMQNSKVPLVAIPGS